MADAGIDEVAPTVEEEGSDRSDSDDSSSSSSDCSAAESEFNFVHERFGEDFKWFHLGSKSHILFSMFGKLAIPYCKHESGTPFLSQPKWGSGWSTDLASRGICNTCDVEWLELHSESMTAQ